MGRPKGSKNKPKSSVDKVLHPDHSQPAAQEQLPAEANHPDDKKSRPAKHAYVPQTLLNEVTRWLAMNDIDYETMESTDPEFRKCLIVDSLTGTMLDALYSDIVVRDSG